MHPRLRADCASAMIVYFQTKAHHLRAVDEGTNLLFPAVFGSISVLWCTVSRIFDVAEGR